MSSVNISTRNKITPTISWTSDTGVTDSFANEEILHLFRELIEDLEIRDFESVSSNGKFLISSLKNILSGLENDRLHELKGWISTLLLSFSKLLKTGLKNPTDGIVDELGITLKGLSEACNDLFQSLPRNGIQSLDSASKKHFLVSKKMILTDVCDYPSPVSAKSTPSLSKADLNFVRVLSYNH